MAITSSQIQTQIDALWEAYGNVIHSASTPGGSSYQREKLRDIREEIDALERKKEALDDNADTDKGAPVVRFQEIDN